MDETFIGGVKPGKRGRGADGKVLVAGAIQRAPGGRRGFGRARLAVISSAKAAALRPFITANVSPGSVVISDALSSYPNAVAGPEYEHNPINVKRSGLKAHQVLPGVHRLFSLAKRWLEGTHQGGIDADHMQSYLDEFIFRFNRRTARKRGLLFLRLLERAVEADPIRYVDIVANPQEKRARACRPAVAPGPVRSQPLRSTDPGGRWDRRGNRRATTAPIWIPLFVKGQLARAVMPPPLRPPVQSRAFQPARENSARGNAGERIARRLF